MTALLVGALGIGLGWARVGPRWASETTRVAGAEPLLEGGPLEERLTDPPVDTAMAGRAEPAPSALGHSWTANVQYGVFGDLLRTLAQQLRESVVYDQPDASLLAAVEWSLDRHHTRAVDTLRGVLSQDLEFLQHARRLKRYLDEEVEAGTGERHERFARILRVVAPALVEAPTLRPATSAGAD
jgi:hypothetical protein